MIPLYFWYDRVNQRSLKQLMLTLEVSNNHLGRSFWAGPIQRYTVWNSPGIMYTDYQMCFLCALVRALPIHFLSFEMPRAALWSFWTGKVRSLWLCQRFLKLYFKLLKASQRKDKIPISGIFLESFALMVSGSAALPVTVRSMASDLSHYFANAYGIPSRDGDK